MYRSNFPAMTAHGWKRGSIINQINYLHRPVCDAVEAYDPDNIDDTLVALLIVQAEVQTTIDMILSRYTADLDGKHHQLIKDSRDMVDEGIDVALWLEANKEG